MGFARNACKEIIFMDRGKIVEQGAPAQFFTSPREERTQQFLSQILH
jgi:general L-amino acid transport system ATP-binding protein